MINNIGVNVPEILMPKSGVDMARWAVVACDQYTSQPEYWDECLRIIGDAPSTLNLMLPELYLDNPDEDKRIEQINACMRKYMQDGTLESIGTGFMLVRRIVEGKTRIGLVLALDLECYDYSKDSSSLIRATEGTIVERIPPRLRIRCDAPLELPHIIVLIDDPDRTVIEPLVPMFDTKEPFYDFELMQDGGHITGIHIADQASIDSILSALDKLASPAAFRQKYGDRPMLLFAMGDGNHSFATAKANWENIKSTLSQADMKNHPARFALVELENLHDEGIVFEPIHRILFNIDAPKILSRLFSLLEANNGGCKRFECASKSELEVMLASHTKEGSHLLPFSYSDGFGFFAVESPAAQLEVGTLQNALDTLLSESEYKQSTIDYVHGDNVVYSISSREGNLGFILPPMEKSALFPTVIYDGALPRKTFSMGEANEKRYYLESKRIK